MICQKCKEQGLKSTVYSGPCYSTAMYFTPFWDENGVFHKHDGNITTASFTCSNGHSWIDVSKNKCPNCEWGRE